MNVIFEVDALVRNELLLEKPWKFKFTLPKLLSTLLNWILNGPEKRISDVFRGYKKRAFGRNMLCVIDLSYNHPILQLNFSYVLDVDSICKSKIELLDPHVLKYSPGKAETLVIFYILDVQANKPFSEL